MIASWCRSGSAAASVAESAPSDSLAAVANSLCSKPLRPSPRVWGGFASPYPGANTIKATSGRAATECHRFPLHANAFNWRNSRRVSPLTHTPNAIKTKLPNAAVGSTPDGQSLQGHAANAVAQPKYDSRPAARTVTTHVMDAYFTSLPMRQPPYPLAAL